MGVGDFFDQATARAGFLGDAAERPGATHDGGECFQRLGVVHAEFILIENVVAALGVKKDAHGVRIALLAEETKEVRFDAVPS